MRHFFDRRCNLGKDKRMFFIGLAEEVAQRNINVIDWFVMCLKINWLLLIEFLRLQYLSVR